MGSVDKQTRTVDNSVYNLENRPCTEVAVRLYTGKTHQIRVAFSHMGHPLVGDTLYGAKTYRETIFLTGYESYFYTYAFW